ncbi:hypothetical protein BpHYR1_004013 [Brachionus plicatilis]|uniref:Uncharacterized protein n=1 Tax=Brachionus plicatilis TaxID=10195 RepID=A0A3M7T1D8_BRAPC|nr:hypothetical protein BpHYR1_004013 [Brachionus plicatilis]
MIFPNKEKNSMEKKNKPFSAHFTTTPLKILRELRSFSSALNFFDRLNSLSLFRAPILSSQLTLLNSDLINRKNSHLNLLLSGDVVCCGCWSVLWSNFSNSKVECRTRSYSIGLDVMFIDSTCRLTVPIGTWDFSKFSFEILK